MVGASERKSRQAPTVGLVLDRHDAPGATAAEIAAAHDLDLAVQDKYGVRYVTYWLDEGDAAEFCLAEGPDRESLEAVHRDAHGLVADSPPRTRPPLSQPWTTEQGAGQSEMLPTPSRAGRFRTRALSGNEEAETKLCRLEIEEFTVALGPPTRCEVGTEAAHRPLLCVRPDVGPDRYATTDALIQVRLGPPPVGLEKAVSAVPRNEHRLDLRSDGASQLSSETDTGGPDLGQVVASQPKLLMPALIVGVTGEHHHATSNSLHLAKARNRVLPMMDSGERHRGVEGLVCERKALSYGSDTPRCTFRTLRTHDRRRLHGGHVAIGGLV